MSGAENMANASGLSFARLLGVISPKISTTTVITTVETVAPMSPYRLTNRTVPMDAEAMLTMLLPIRMVESSRSYRSESRQASAARRLPFSASALSLVLFSDENAVSVAEK